MGLEPTIFAMLLSPESNALPLGHGYQLVSVDQTFIGDLNLLPIDKQSELCTEWLRIFPRKSNHYILP